MPDVLRIKRRAVGGAAGAPASLAAAEIAYNEQTNILYYGGGNSLGLATSIFPIAGPGAFLALTGGALTGGISFGGALAPGGASDLSRHISLHSGGYGLSITSGRLNHVVAGGGVHAFVVGGADIGLFTATGLNNTVIGASTAAAGSFTTLTAASTVTLSGGLSFGSTAAANTTDLSRHIALYGTTQGFNVSTANRLNIVAGLTLGVMIGGVELATITSAGITSTAPTAAAGDESTSLATTDFAVRAASSYRVPTMPDADTTLTTANVSGGYTSFIGALTANRIAYLPLTNTQRVWTLGNGTTGGFNLTFSNAGGTSSFVFPPGYRAQLFTDGGSLYPIPNMLLAATLRLGDATRNAILFTMGATTATTSIDVTGTGVLQFNSNPVFNAGLSLGSTFAASPTDLSRHIVVYGVNGFSQTFARLNYVAGSTVAHWFIVNSIDVASISSTGINAAAIGATTPSTGAFTTLSATGTVSGTGFTTLLAGYLPLTGGALSNGISFSGGAVVGVTDFSEHIQFAAGYGFNLTSGRIAMVSAATAAIAIGTADKVLVTSGGVRVGDGLNAFGLTVSGAAATQRQLNFWTGTGATAPRWIIYANQTAEAGTEAGTDLAMGRYNDSGTFIDHVWTVTRSTGNTAYNHGVGFATAVAASATDLSRHLALYSTTYGFDVTLNRLNYVAPTGAAHWFIINAVDVASITATGINAAAIGATTPSTGSFTTLAASGVVSGAGFTTLLSPYATLASPPLTGTPTAPSAAVGTNDTTIATTLFANRVAAGYVLATTVDADTTLTAAQVGYRVIRFGGALTADRTYTLPASQQRTWFLYNNTTGGFALNFTMGGNTISIPAGFKTEVYTDATSMFAGGNYIAAGQLRIGPPANNAFSFVSGATTATAATIDLTGTGVLQFLISPVMTAGLTFGTALASSVTDLTRHLTLYSTTYGFGVTSGRLNYNAGAAAAHVFMCGGTDVGSVNVASGFVGTTPTAAPGTNTTALANTAFVTAAVAAYADDIGRNYLHNSLFRIWQRGTGVTSTSATYSADRWLFMKGADTLAGTRIAITDAERTAIGDEDAAYAMQIGFTGTAAAGDYVALQQRIEGVRRLSGKSLTVSFYAVAAAGTPKVGASADQIFGTGGSPSASVNGVGQSVTIGTAFARYSVALATLASASAKVFGTNGDDSTAINLWVSSGTTNATRSGTVGVQGGTIKIWGVQVEIGALTPLEKIDLAHEWNNCQRFYQTATVGLTSYAAASAVFGLFSVFPVPMQRIPTVAVSGAAYANAGTAAANTITASHFFAQAVAAAIGMATFSFAYQASADL